MNPWITRASIAFLLLAAFLPRAAAQEDVPALVKKIQPGVVMILIYDKAGKALGQGSGFFISGKGNVITNRHVLAGAHRAEIKASDGKVYPVKSVLVEDKAGDLLMMSVDIPTGAVRPLKLGAAVPETGEKILVIGNPFGLEKTVSDGIVSAVRDIPGFGKIIQITAPLSSGSNGSPVVNLKGEVIGVATFIMRKGQNLNFAVPAERVGKPAPGKGKTLAQWSAGRGEERAKSAEGLYRKGLVLLWTDEYDKALPWFKRAAARDPRNAAAYFCIGYCCDRLGRHQEAVDAYKQAIRINPDDAKAHYNLGAAYDNLGRHQEAVDAYKQAIRIKPDYADARYNLGVAYWRLGRHQEAVEAFKQAIRIKPDHAKAHYSLGVVYGKLGRHQEAVDAFKQAIRIKPDLAKAHFNLGVTYLITGDKASALDQYKVLRKLEKELAKKLFGLIYK